MSAFDSSPRPSWWRILRQPQRTFRAMIAGGRGRFNLLVIFLGGIALFQIWADLFNLADQYPVGKIMGMTLIMGPIAGLLFAALLSALALSLGNLLDATHKVAYTYHDIAPPFPLKRLLWQRILGKERITALFQAAPLSWYGKGWSVLISRWRWVRMNISGGKASFDLLFSGVSAAMTVLVFANFFLWLELVLYDGNQFFSVAPDGAAGSPIFLLLLKLGFAGWLLYLWWTLLKQGFQLTLVPALLATLASFVLAAGLTILLLTTIFQLPVF